MELKLHKLARTTPAIRKEIQSSTLSYRDLCKKYGVSQDTIYKWRKRKEVTDKSHARHNLLSSINETEEMLIKGLRKDLRLSLDDIVEVMRRCVNPKLSRSAIYRCLKRLGIAKRAQNSHDTTFKTFEEEQLPGYIHMDVKYLTRLKKTRSYVYVAIDRATRFVYVEVHYNLEQNTAAKFIERFREAFPCPIRVILTDNGFEWTDRCAAQVKEKATGYHPVL